MNIADEHISGSGSSIKNRAKTTFTSDGGSEHIFEDGSRIFNDCSGNRVAQDWNGKQTSSGSFVEKVSNFGLIRQSSSFILQLYRKR